MRNIKSDRNYVVFLLLDIITCGVYGIIVMSQFSEEINSIASKYDKKDTMHYCLMNFVLAPLTSGIWRMVWYHQLSERIGDELARREIDYKFSPMDFWGWYFLGAFILVGPFVYFIKFFKAMNLLAEDYNIHG